MAAAKGTFDMDALLARVKCVTMRDTAPPRVIQNCMCRGMCQMASKEVKGLWHTYEEAQTAATEAAKAEWVRRLDAALQYYEEKGRITVVCEGRTALMDFRTKTEVTDDPDFKSARVEPLFHRAG